MGECDTSGDRLDLDGLVIAKQGKDGDLIGSLRHKIEVKGDVFTTGVRWDADSPS